MSIRKKFEMKIKKKLFLIIIVLFLLIIMVIVIARPSETSKTQALSPVSQETIEVNQNSDDYLEGIDCEYYWGYVGSRPWLEGAMITKGNDGYYYYDSSNSLLCYFDPEQGTSTVLCSRPNCSHDSDKCSAWYGNYSVMWIQYSCDAIYLVAGTYSDSFEVGLYRVQKDGTSFEKAADLYRSEGGASGDIMIHRGYIYYALYGTDLEDSIYLYRLRLDAKEEAELLCEFSGTDLEVSLLAYGNYVYCEVDSYDDGEIQGALQRFCIQGGEMELLLEDFWHLYAVADGVLYYDNGTQVIAHDLVSGEEQVLCEPGMSVYMAFNGEYLLLDNDCGIFLLGDLAADVQRTLTVWNLQGDILAELPVEGDYTQVLFGDAEYLFSIQPDVTESGNYVDYYCAMSIDDLLDGNGEWVKLDAS